MITNNAKELNEKAIELNKITRVISESKTSATNTPIWTPLSQAIQLDNKNTFSIVTKLNRIAYQSSFNGKERRLLSGARIEYEGINGNTCYVNFIGVKEGLYGVALHCD